MTQVKVNTKIHSVAKEHLGKICLSAGFGYPISNAWKVEERRRASERVTYNTRFPWKKKKEEKHEKQLPERERKRSGVFSYGRTKNTPSGRTCKQGILKS